MNVIDRSWAERYDEKAIIRMDGKNDAWVYGHAVTLSQMR